MAKDYKGYMYFRTASDGQEYIYYTPYKGRQKASGLLNTARNRKIVEQKLRETYLDYLQKHRNMPISKESTKITVKEAFDEFIKSKNREVKTNKSYGYAFRKIINENYYLDQTVTTFVNNRHKSKYRVEIDCKDFMRGNDNLSPTSKNIILRSFQAFLTWCSYEEYLPEIKAFRKYKSKKVKKKEVLPYSQNEIDKMLDYLKNKNRELYLYVKFLCYTGSRGKEALELRISDIDLNNEKIKFRNKINKNNFDYIPITNEAKPVIKELVERSKNRSNRQNYLFKYNINSLRYIARSLEDIQKKLGIKKEGRLLHGFRKYFINKLFDAKIGGHDLSIFKLQKLARHSDINITVDHYREYKNKELKEDMDKIF